MSSSEATTRSLSATAALADGQDLWVLVSAPSGSKWYTLAPHQDMIVGRSAAADIVVDDPSVSRRHALLRDGRLSDLGSRNGTRVGGRWLEESEQVAVDIGSVIEVGRCVLVVQRGRVAVGNATERAPESSVVVDPLMLQLHELARVIGRSSLNVIVLGETGTGKERYAEAVHAASDRASAPMLRVNCAALDGTLLDSELFGHEKGAFTGAHTARIGLLEAASGGTVLLDELGELPLETQAKLLRAVETGEVWRVGAREPRRVDVRYISATSRDLAQAATDGAFRSDLLYRLNGFCVTLPPLRRRRGEIAPLAARFLDDAATREGRPKPNMTGRAKAKLEAYAWPGNVRELRNVVERAVALARNGRTIDETHIVFDQTLVPLAGRAHALAVLRDRDRVADALARTHGNQTAAARLLGVSRRALVNRMKEYALGDHAPTSSRS